MARKSKAKKKYKGLFSKVTVACILLFMASLAVWAFKILADTGVDATSLLTAIYAFFGFELAALLLKRIFAKEDAKEDEDKNVKDAKEDRKDDLYDNIELDGR